MALLNKFSSGAMGFQERASQTYQPSDSEAPPNDHGDNLFLVKMQVPLVAGPSSECASRLRPKAMEKMFPPSMGESETKP